MNKGIEKVIWTSWWVDRWVGIMLTSQHVVGKSIVNIFRLPVKSPFVDVGSQMSCDLEVL